MFGDTIKMELIGGSRDGELIEATAVPDFLNARAGNGWIEVYERLNDAPPFVYVQIGYVEEVQRK